MAATAASTPPQHITNMGDPNRTALHHALELGAHVVQILLKSADFATLMAWKALAQRNSIVVSSGAYVPGELNTQADDASRIIQPSPTDLLAFFNTKYPQRVS